LLLLKPNSLSKILTAREKAPGLHAIEFAAQLSILRTGLLVAHPSLSMTASKPFG
jgi:hypothetical protein